LPNTREGATLVHLDSNVYLFGGFARDRYNEMNILSLGLESHQNMSSSSVGGRDKWKWKTIFSGNPKSEFEESNIMDFSESSRERD
jgi:hypothetical protein